MSRSHPPARHLHLFHLPHRHSLNQPLLVFQHLGTLESLVGVLRSEGGPGEHTSISPEEAALCEQGTPSPVLRRTALSLMLLTFVALGLRCRARASHCTASAVARAPGPWATVVVMHRLSFLCMWGLPWTRDGTHPAFHLSPGTGRQIPNHSTAGEVLTTVLSVLRC